MSPGSHRPRGPVRLIPFFRNARIPFLKVTTATALRALLLAIMLMAAAVAVAIWKLYGLSEANHNNVTAGRQARLEFQREIQQQQDYTQAQVRALACSVVAFTPPERSNDFVRSLASNYHCDPYRPPKSVPPPPSTPGASPRPAGTVTATVTSRPATLSYTAAPTSAPPAASRRPSAAPTSTPSTRPACLPVVGCLP